MTKKNNIKISIIIPVYNAEKYLEECLNSLVNQTLKSIEIICVNDGSTDNSLEILEKYKKKYNNIRLFSQENKGVNAARVVGYENAIGEYIAWVDADDFVTLDMYEKMYNLAIKNDSDIVSCNYNFYPKKVINKEKWFKEYKGIVDWKFISRNTIQWNKIVKKQLLEKINITSLFKEIGEGCYSMVLISTNKITTTNECLYYYRVGQTSLSTNYKNIEWYKNTVVKSEKSYNYIINHNYAKEWIEYYFYLYLYYNLLLLIVAGYNNDTVTYKKAQQILKKNKLFSKKYEKYLKNHFSNLKIFVLKNLCLRSCFITYVLANLILK